MYDNWFRLKWDTWNNSFSYNIRKKNNPDPQIYVTNLIQWTIDDIQIWDKVVFEEIDHKWQIQPFVWLKNFVKLKNCHSDPAGLRGEESRIENINKTLDVSLYSTWQEIPIYIFDNHNHALFFRYQELFNWNISKWVNLIHIDQHTDMNNNSEFIIKNAKLKDIFQFTNYQCNVWNFIQPAIQDWLISQVFQINTEYSLLNNYSHCEEWNDEAILNKKKIATTAACLPDRQASNDNEFILDIDLDFRHPQMWIEEYDKSIHITKNLISKAILVTIATSPYFLDQTLAIKILKDIFR